MPLMPWCAGFRTPQPILDVLERITRTTSMLRLAWLVRSPSTYKIIGEPRRRLQRLTVSGHIRKKGETHVIYGFKRSRAARLFGSEWQSCNNDVIHSISFWAIPSNRLRNSFGIRDY